MEGQLDFKIQRNYNIIVPVLLKLMSRTKEREYR